MNQSITNNCFHCGDDCGPRPIVHAEKNFCCSSCKTVFQLLQDSQMTTYYELEQHPGTRKAEDGTSRFDYLSQPAIIAQLIDYQDEEQVRITFSLPQIHCSSCIWLLEHLYRLHKGISQANVNFLRKELYLTFDPQQIDLQEVAELLTAIGYEPDIRLKDLNNSKTHRPKRRLYYQLGVAGFFFGNIMLLSFPEYLTFGHELEPIYARFFSYLNLLLILPVLLYSASSYFRSGWLSLVQKHPNIDVPISLGMLALFGRSAFEILTQSGAGYLDSLAGLVFFLLIGKWFQQKTYDAISFDRDYAAYFPLACTQIVDERHTSVALHDLKVGDQILVRNQELIPADAVLMSPNAQIDYSFVTGESEPVQRKAGDAIYAGGRQLGPSIELTLTKSVSQSYLTRLWDHATFGAEKPDQLSRWVDRVASAFTVIILAIATLSGGYWWLTAGAGMGVNVFSAVLIIACPCALALTLPFTMGNTMRIMGEKGLFLRNTSVIGRMAKVDQLVFDKTGTLTATKALSVTEAPASLSASDIQLLVSLAGQSTHPISRAIVAHYPPQVPLPVEEVAEMPGSGIEGRVNGQWVKIGSAGFLGMEGDVAENGTWCAIAGQPLGFFRMHAPARAGLGDLLKRLSSRFRLALLSGDRQAGNEQLTALFPQNTPLHFRQSPYDKLHYIENLQANGHSALMLGDGLNDAGALQQSDVGLAVAEDVHSFSPACDGILDADHLGRLGEMLAFARKSMALVKVGFAIAFLYNVVGLAFAVQGLLSPLVAAILMPLSSVTIVLWAMGSTRVVGRFNEKG